MGYRRGVAIIHPFAALRPAPGLAARVCCPPYDVINSREARALYGGRAESFLRVTRPEVGLAEGTEEHADEVYEEGKRALEALRREGVLVQDTAGLWLYGQELGGHRQVGLVACVSVEEYDQDLIKKHEKTRPDKEDDRARHIDVLGAHDEPVFLTYRAHPGIDALVSVLTAAAPLEDFTTDDGVRHTIWAVDPTCQRELVELFSREVPSLYVADGHHRSAAASRVARARAGQPGEQDRFLAVVFPHDQMQILPYNRLVRDRQRRPPEELLALLGERLDLSPASRPEPPGPRSFGLLVGGRWHWGKVRRGSFDEADPIASLDCSLCQDQILAPLFGVTDPRTDRNLEFVGGIRGAAELERRAAVEGFALAVYLHPTSIEQLLRVSDAGLLMPPKSTWFEPKLRSGLFAHPF
jgi:uncharacterized protein (DUF1015 family)